MNPLFTKGALIVAGIGGASAVGGGIYYLTSENNSKPQEESKQKPNKEVITPKVTASESVNNLLKTKKLRLLTSEAKDSEEWAKSWDKFKAAYPSLNPKTPWTFNEWDENKDKPETLESFKKQCESFSAKTVTGEQDNFFVAISTYCSIKDDVQIS